MVQAVVVVEKVKEVLRKDLCRVYLAGSFRL